METNDHTSIESESSVSWPAPSIYRVPKRLRHVKNKVYTPKVVSIGPLHHGRKELQAMENYKEKYLDDFIRKTNRSEARYYEILGEKEDRLRACYAEIIRFDKDKFLQIILKDAAFIIGFLLRFSYSEERDGKDRIFGKPWMKHDICLDMLLLENQLPFFILKELFPRKMTYTSNRGNNVSIDIVDLSWFFFKEVMHLEFMDSGLDEICLFGIRHFIDFLRFLHVVPNEQNRGNEQSIWDEQNRGRLVQIRSSDGIQHFVDFLRFLYLPPIEQSRGKIQTITIPSITELLHAGVKFKARSNKSLFDLQFKNGTLEIPKLVIGDETEISMRNLIAFEQCYYKDRCINDYVVLMNRLVNTKKDVDLVVKYGILENRLSNNRKGSCLMNKLEEGVILNFDEFCFASLCGKLDKYCSSRWRKWRADLMQNYFSTPWTTASVIAAVILLILTLIQTVYTVKSHHRG